MNTSRRSFLSTLAAAPVALLALSRAKATPTLSIVTTKNVGLGTPTPSIPLVMAAPRVSVPLRWETLFTIPLPVPVLWQSAFAGPVLVGASHSSDDQWRWHVGSVSGGDIAGVCETQEQARAAVQSAWDNLIGATPAPARPVEVKGLEWTFHSDPLYPLYPRWVARYGKEGDMFNRDTPIGGVNKADEGFCSYLSRSVGQWTGRFEEDHSTLEAAQSAVEFHWSAFIRGALA